MNRRQRPGSSLPENEASGREWEDFAEVEATRAALVGAACERVAECARLITGSLVLARHRLARDEECFDDEVRRMLDSSERAARWIPEITLELLSALELDREMVDRAVDEADDRSHHALAPSIRSNRRTT